MAGTISVVQTKVNGAMKKITFTCVADAADGSFPATQTDFAINGYITKVKTIPGATQPTDNWDATLKDEDGIDVMGGQLADRDTANAEEKIPLIGGDVYGENFVDQKLTLAITGNSVNSANIEVEVFVRQESWV